VNFDDQDWELGQPPREELRGTSIAWKVGAGFVLGLVLGGALMQTLGRQWAQEPTRVKAGATIERSMRDAPPRAGGVPTVALPVASDQGGLALPEAPGKAAEAVLPVTPGKASAVAEGEAEPAAALALRAARLAAERKAREWAGFYKKPPLCDDNPNKDVMIECANHYIRAKRQFDEAYGAGRRAVAP
jgi:hypothetical protein